MQVSPRNSVLAFSLLAGILAVSTAAIFIRFAQRESVPSIVIAAMRLTIASLVLAPLAVTRHRAELARLSRSTWMLALLSGILPGAAFCRLDHLARIYQRRKFGCAGNHHTIMGSAAFSACASTTRSDGPPWPGWYWHSPEVW